MRTSNSPAAWFVMSELARRRGDRAAATRALDQLQRLGVLVEYIDSTGPGHANARRRTRRSSDHGRTGAAKRGRRRSPGPNQDGGQAPTARGLAGPGGKP